MIVSQKLGCPIFCILDGKLIQSGEANRDLTLQLENIEPLVAKLEELLEETKLELKEEKRLRQQAEICQAEAEARCNDMEGSKEAQDELLDELEALTNQFIETQNRLAETEDLLQEESEKVRELEMELSEKNDVDGDSDSSEDDRYENRGNGSAKSRIQQLERMLKEQKAGNRTTNDELKIAKQANDKLKEEVTCLREALDAAVKGEYHKDPDFQAKAREDAEKKEAELRKTITKEITGTLLKECKAEKDRDVNALREKFKEIFKENSVLREKVDHGEQAMLQAEDLKVEAAKLKEELSRLTLALEKEQESHEVDVSKVELSWKEKFNNTVTEANKEKGENIKTLTSTLQENEKLKEQLQISEGSLKASRDEILKLKEIVSELNDLLDETNVELEEHKCLLEESKHDTSCVNDELLEARRRLRNLDEDARLAHDENSMFKKMILSLNNAIDQSKDEKGDVLEQLEIVTRHLAKARRAIQLPHEDDLTQSSDASMDLAGVGIAYDILDLVEDTTQRSARSLDDILEENMRLEKKLLETEATATNLRGELESTQSTVVSLRADLIEYEAHAMLSKLSLKERKGVYAEDIISLVGDDEDGLLDRDVIIDAEKGFASVSLAVSEDANETEKLKLSLLVSRDEILILKKQVERLKMELDNNMTDRVKELATRRREDGLVSGTEEKVVPVQSNKIDAPSVNAKKGEQKDDLVSALVEENSALQKRLEKAEFALNVLEEQQLVSANRDDEIRLLREQINKNTEDRSVLQHQIDDAKIALNVSQYGLEKNKEELRSCEIQLERSREEVFALKKEVAKVDSALFCAKKDYSLAVGELKALKKRVGHKDIQPENEKLEPDDLSELKDQLQLAQQETSKLQFKVIGLEKALSISQKAFQDKQDEIDLSERELQIKNETLESMEASLMSSQEETRMLTEEISHLSAALENAKSEYDAVVDELEAVNELFDEARQDAEKSGRAAAAEEIQREVELASEREKTLLRDQLKRILEENSKLQRKLDETEMSLVVAKSVQKRSTESESEAWFREQLEALTEALRISKAETRSFQEEASNMRMELESSAMKNTTHDGKVKALNHQLSGLSIENAMLQSKLEMATVALQKTQISQCNGDEAEISPSTINMKDLEHENNEESDASPDAEARTMEPENNVDYIRCKEELKSSKKEVIHFKNEVSKLKQALEHANADHVYLRSQLEKMNHRVLELCSQAEERGRQEMRAMFENARNQELGVAMFGDNRAQILQEKPEIPVTATRENQKESDVLAIEDSLRASTSPTTKRGPLRQEPSQLDIEVSADEELAINEDKSLRPFNDQALSEMRDDVDFCYQSNFERQRSHPSSPLPRQTDGSDGSFERPVGPDVGVEIRRKRWKEALELKRSGRLAHILSNARRVGHSQNGMLSKSTEDHAENEAESLQVQTVED